MASCPHCGRSHRTEAAQERCENWQARKAKRAAEKAEPTPESESKPVHTGPVLAELLIEEVQIEITGDVGDRVVPGAEQSDEAYRLPLSWAACKMLRGVFGDDLEIGPKLEAWAEEERVQRVDAANSARVSEDGPRVEIVADDDSSDDRREAPAVVPERQWWWDVWRGMPEYVQRNIGPWKTVKIHVRDREDFERLQKQLGVKLNTTKNNMPACWFPPSPELPEDSWRYVDEDSDPSELPQYASAMKEIPLRRARAKPEAKEKEKAPKKEKQLLASKLLKKGKLQ